MVLSRVSNGSLYRLHYIASSQLIIPDTFRNLILQGAAIQPDLDPPPPIFHVQESVDLHKFACGRPAPIVKRAQPAELAPLADGVKVHTRRTAQQILFAGLSFQEETTIAHN